MELSPSAAHLARQLLDETIPVVVLGYQVQCWRCGSHEITPAVIHRDGYFDPFSVLDAAEGHLAGMVRDLLARRGQPSSTAIHRRWSKSTRSEYVSQGCGRCDALFGAYFLHDTFADHAVNETFHLLPVVVATEVARLEWVLAETVHGNTDLG